MKKLILMLFLAVTLCALDKDELEIRKNYYRNMKNTDQLQASMDRLIKAKEDMDESVENFQERLNPRYKKRSALEKHIGNIIYNCDIAELQSKLDARNEAREKLAEVVKESIIKNGKKASLEKIFALEEADDEIKSLEKNLRTRESKCEGLVSLKNELRNLNSEIERDEGKIKGFLQNIGENEELIKFIKSRIAELKNQPIKSEMPAEKPRRRPPFIQRAKNEADKALRVVQKKI